MPDKIEIPKEFSVFRVFGSDDFHRTYDAIESLYCNSFGPVQSFPEKLEALYYARLLLKKYKFSYILKTINKDAHGAITWVVQEQLNYKMQTNKNIAEDALFDIEFQVFRLKKDDIIKSY